ncbi:MAG: (2Fe-2S)-binding protein [Bryobacteraceae bacterium]|nr:(2Fe-2S)-binding protein [Bryobacteraceae bacterium]
MQCVVNETPQKLTVERSRTLLSVLRDDLGLTGCKYGCGEGECGACTVLLDGQPVRSCQTPIGHCQGKSITTVEGLARGDQLHPVQRAFLELGAMQCGYCTPGMILSTVALLAAKPRPTDEEILDWMNIHLCRCNGYVKILRAIRRAAGRTPG